MCVCVRARLSVLKDLYVRAANDKMEYGMKLSVKNYKFLFTVTKSAKQEHWLHHKEKMKDEADQTKWRRPGTTEKIT